MYVKLWALWVMVITSGGEIETRPMNMVFGEVGTCQAVARQYTRNQEKWPDSVDFRVIYYCTRTGKDA